MIQVAKSEQTLSPGLRNAVAVTVGINALIGLAFLFGPEFGINLWPTTIPPLLMRFIGSIVLGNGVGAWMIYKDSTWESARVLFTVALVYGALIVPALLYHLIIKDAPTIFWGYALVDLLFLIPIIFIYKRYQKAK
jgi:hypothetical protein